MNRFFLHTTFSFVVFNFSYICICITGSLCISFIISRNSRYVCLNHLCNNVKMNIYFLLLLLLRSSKLKSSATAKLELTSHVSINVFRSLRFCSNKASDINKTNYKSNCSIFMIVIISTQRHKRSVFFIYSNYQHGFLGKTVDK